MPGNPRTAPSDDGPDDVAERRPGVTAAVATLTRSCRCPAAKTRRDPVPDRITAAATVGCRSSRLNARLKAVAAPSTGRCSRETLVRSSMIGLPASCMRCTGAPRTARSPPIWSRDGRAISVASDRVARRRSPSGRAIRSVRALPTPASKTASTTMSALGGRRVLVVGPAGRDPAPHRPASEPPQPLDHAVDVTGSPRWPRFRHGHRGVVRRAGHLPAAWRHLGDARTHQTGADHRESTRHRSSR